MNETVVETTDQWSLYLIRCGDGSLYTGISTDVSRRFKEHENTDNRNLGAKALRGKNPLAIAYQIRVGNRSQASKLEYKIKQLKKSDKERLIEQRPLAENIQCWLEGLS